MLLEKIESKIQKLPKAEEDPAVEKTQMEKSIEEISNITSLRGRVKDIELLDDKYGVVTLEVPVESETGDKFFFVSVYRSRPNDTWKEFSQISFFKETAIIRAIGARRLGHESESYSVAAKLLGFGEI